MSRFKQGDRVIVNGGLIATIEWWDEENNRASWASYEGGARNVHSDHITQNRFEALPAAVEKTSLASTEEHPTRDSVSLEAVELPFPPLGERRPHVGPEGEPK